MATINGQIAEVSSVPTCIRGCAEEYSSKEAQTLTNGLANKELMVPLTDWVRGREVTCSSGTRPGGAAASETVRDVTRNLLDEVAG